jgi:hypothetical protein
MYPCTKQDDKTQTRREQEVGAGDDDNATSHLFLDDTTNLSSLES